MINLGLYTEFEVCKLMSTVRT